ncbi:hypothetical protein ACFFRR_002845 [Megaselia abdita]
MPPTILPEQETLRERVVFIIKSASIALLALTFSMIQWYLVDFIPAMEQFFINYFYISLAFGVFGMVALILFLMTPEIRKTRPFNILLIILVYEFLILFLISILVAATAFELTVAVLVAVPILSILYVIGKFCPVDFTSFAIFIIVAIVVFLVAFITLIILLSFIKSCIIVTCAATTGLLFTFLFNIYHAQLLLGGRKEAIDVSEYLMGSLVIYLDLAYLYVNMLILYKGAGCIGDKTYEN